MQSQTPQTTQLPNEAYTSPEFFQLELKYIFTQHWNVAGLVEDITQPGDFLTTQVGLVNIVVLLNEQHQLLAFHNMCSHRGTKLLDDSGNINELNDSNSIVCPYHDWRFSLSGRLTKIPGERREFSGVEKACFNLTPAKVACWRGMIWVHPDSEAMALDTWLAPIKQHVAPYQVESLLEAKDEVISQEIKANWKIVVENYIDHYHLSHLHAGTLNMYAHSKAEFGFEGAHFRFWEPLAKDYQQGIENNSPMPLLISPEHPKLGAWVPMLFPGIGLAESESSWSLFHIVPLAVDKTLVHIRTKVRNASLLAFAAQASRSYSYWQQKIKAKNNKVSNKHPLGSADFMQEDIYVCEQLQSSLNNPYFTANTIGAAAKLGEQPIRDHQALVWQLIAPHWV